MSQRRTIAEFRSISLDEHHTLDTLIGALADADLQLSALGIEQRGLSYEVDCDDYYDHDVKIHISGTRPETDQERDARLALEKANANAARARSLRAKRAAEAKKTKAAAERKTLYLKLREEFEPNVSQDNGG